jgi:hypothetical protein
LGLFDGDTFGEIELRPIRALKKLNLFKLLTAAFVCELEFWTLGVRNEDMELWFLVRV